MTSRTVTQQEMDRRLEMAKAKESLTKGMAGHSLTAMEWVCVLNEISQRMVSIGLKEEWEEFGSCHET